MRIAPWFLALSLLMGNAAIGDPRWVEGKYRNPALGYSVVIPQGLKGMIGDQVGPERGVSIPLASGGNIVTYGEPNSLEWKTPSDGVNAELSYGKCSSADTTVSETKVGQVAGAKGVRFCGEQVVELFVAFRRGGGPVYSLRLNTTCAHFSEDSAVLRKVVESFRIIRWE